MLLNPLRSAALSGLMLAQVAIASAQTPEGLAEGSEKWCFTVDFTKHMEENDPPWHSGGNGEAFVQNGKLHLRSDLQGGMTYNLIGETNSPIWDGSKASTIQFRVRVIDSEESAVAAHVTVRTGDRLFLIPIIDREEQTYRFLFEESGDGRLFINNVEQGVVRARPLADKKAMNAILFGDLGKSVGGETEWSEFRWTNEGAFVP